MLCCLISLLSCRAVSALPPSKIRVDSIIIIGNKHTRASIIIRELTFKTGDSIEYSVWQLHAEQSRRQIINLNLFNEVSVITDSTSKIYVAVIERWYFWPSPVIELADRNFNQWWLTKDPRRLVYGVRLKWFNVRGRNETMYLTLNAGYTRKIDFTYKMPYINRAKTLGLTLYAGASNNKEVWYKTEHDKVQFFKDEDRKLIVRSGIEANVQYRRKIFSYHNFVIGHRYTHVADTVLATDVNQSFLLNAYTKQSEIYQSYSFTHDRRDIRGYALRGHYLKAIITNNVINPGSKSYQYLMVKATYSQYVPLYKRWYAGASVTTRWCSVRQLPYNNIRALGYNTDYIRGYELYVMDGPSYVLAKSNIKFRCFEKKISTQHKIKNYSSIPVSMYLTAFYDAGKVNNYQPADYLNRMVNSLQYGYGTGLDVIVFYNNVARFEYAFNKYHENRLYIHFIAAL